MMATENWDDDFEFNSHRDGDFEFNSHRDDDSPVRRHQPRPESWDDEFAAASDDELGYDVDEEDRTVTARSRRRLPSPPIPLPLPFPGPSPPLPRSPTSSVFSVPTARPPSSAFTATSTTPLRPASRSSSAAPPTRERERRRLRKKSRPQDTAIELGVIRAGGDEYESAGRPCTPRGVRSTAPPETPHRDRARPTSQASVSSSASSNAPRRDEDPTRLVKRKSSGFMQIKRGFGFGDAGTPNGKEGSPPVVPDDKEGTRSFMGSVRRISLAVRHKSVIRKLNLTSPSPIAPAKTPTLETPESVIRKLNLTSPTPTPPIELQPPSPPRAASMLSPSGSLPPTSTRSQAASLGRSSGPENGVGTSALRRSSLGDLKIPERISQAQVGLRRDMERVREFARGVERLKALQTTYDRLVGDVQSILDRQHQEQQVLQLERQRQLQQEKRPSTPTPTTFFSNIHIRRPRPATANASTSTPSPAHANAYKHLASAYYTIRSKYRISWEYAELLIELGSGSTSTASPTTSVSAPVMSLSSTTTTGRERAVTLNGEDSKPPTPVPAMEWRASTGRDLSQRQLVLLKEILGGEEEGGEEMILEEGSCRWGGMESVVTLPEGEGGNGKQGGKGKGKGKKRRGLREIFKSLVRFQDQDPENGVPPPHPLPPPSTTSLSTTTDSTESHLYPHPRVPRSRSRLRRPQTSAGPGESSSPSSSRYAYAPPRRPSLASIFRIGRGRGAGAGGESEHGAGAGGSASSSRSGSRQDSATSTSTGEEGEGEEDWDRMEDAEDEIEIILGGAVGNQDAAATVRGKKMKTVRGLGHGHGHGGRSPYMCIQDGYPSLASLPGVVTPKRSRSSIWEGSMRSLSGGGGGTPPPAPLSRPTKLSNVDEDTPHPHPHHRPPPKASSRSSFHARMQMHTQTQTQMKSGSVRSMPPEMATAMAMAMTPENIRPLLENARGVQGRLVECIEEVRALLEGYEGEGVQHAGLGCT